jgi:small subunit ribosomal protein S20
MPNLKSAVKAMHQSETRRLVNLKTKDKYKDVLRDFRKLAAAGQKSEAQKKMSEAASFIDRAAKKHVIHKNKANRLKARMAAALAKIK